MKFALVCTLFGAAAAQVELSSSGNDATFQRRQQVTIFEMSSTMAALQAQVDALNSDSSPLALGLQAIAADMTSRTQGIVTQQAAISTQVSSMAASVENSISNAAAANAAAAASLQASISTQLSTQASSLAVTTATLTESLSTTANSIDTRVTRSLESMTSTITATNSSLTRLMSTKANDMKHMWIGGARDWGNGGGFRTFTLNRFDYDTLAPKGRRDGNTIRSLQTGMFKMHYWGIQHGGGHGHGRFYVNGSPITDHYHNSKEYGWWNDLTMHVDWKLNANQRLELRLSSSGHRWHTSGNSPNVYNRLSVMWLGPAGPRCQGCIIA